MTEYETGIRSGLWKRIARSVRSRQFIEDLR
jgi:hypothetical protein